MKITQTQSGGNLVVHVLERRLGADKALPFKEAILRVLAQPFGRLVLDLSEVEFIDSSGLGAMLSILKRMDPGREMVVCGLGEQVASMFKLTRMDRIFTIRGSVEEASAACAR